jgi:hypothetical protein
MKALNIPKIDFIGKQTESTATIIAKLSVKAIFATNPNTR